MSQIQSKGNRKVLELFSLKGKTVIVTGASRGLGLEIARGYAEAGANVAIWYNTTNAHKSAKKIAAANGVKVKAYKCTLSSTEKIAMVMSRVAKDFGKFDIVVINAGVCSDVAAIDYTKEEFRRILSVNLDSAFYTAQAAGQYFKKENIFGNIIFTASVSGKIVNIPQKQSAYNASKHGIVALAKSLSVEWVDFCRINIVSPGYVETEMVESQDKKYLKKWYELVPKGRFCKPEELKGIYVFLASDAASYFQGSDIIIDGAFTVV